MDNFDTGIEVIDKWIAARLIVLEQASQLNMFRSFIYYYLWGPFTAANDGFWEDHPIYSILSWVTIGMLPLVLTIYLGGGLLVFNLLYICGYFVVILVAMLIGIIISLVTTLIGIIISLVTTLALFAWNYIIFPILLFIFVMAMFCAAYLFAIWLTIEVSELLLGVVPQQFYTDTIYVAILSGSWLLLLIAVVANNFREIINGIKHIIGYQQV